jgi:hypothetical protein
MGDNDCRAPLTLAIYSSVASMNTGLNHPRQRLDAAFEHAIADSHALHSTPLRWRRPGVAAIHFLASN